MRIAEFRAPHSQFRISLDRERPCAAKRVDESCTICELIFWKSLIENNEKHKSTQNRAETVQKWFHRDSSEFRVPSSIQFPLYLRERPFKSALQTVLRQIDPRPVPRHCFSIPHPRLAPGPGCADRARARLSMCGPF